MARRILEETYSSGKKVPCRLLFTGNQRGIGQRPRVLRKRLPHEIGSDQSPWKPGGIAYRHFDGSKGFEDY